MPAIRALSAAMLGLGALALTACTSATAGDDVGNPGFGYNLQPETVAPGGRLSLPVQGCKEEATVTSGVFQTVTVPKGGTSATAVIDRNARPGTSYDVAFRCGHEYGHRKLTIGAAHSETAGSKQSGSGGAPDSGGGEGGYGGGGIGGGGYGGGVGAERTAEASGAERTAEASGAVHTAEASGAVHTAEASGTEGTAEASGAEGTAEASAAEGTETVEAAEVMERVKAAAEAGTSSTVCRPVSAAASADSISRRSA